MRLLELTNGYATLARLGTYLPYRLVAGPNKVESLTKEGLVFDPECAWVIADILSDARVRAVAFGLDSSLNLPFRVAVKTGTSTDFRDSWTVGYTPDFTVGVWLGASTIVRLTASRRA
ncbi:MAG: penicillin-binding transpeptidase domain-containing protein [Verrucomicrobiales bacterium]|nr:penicillin-binding transpeptidase domain-containing protein [Verrucomicrobiales bacterium]